MIQTVPETRSTSADLLARLAAGERIAEGYWLVADRQTGGRGRQGRSWLDAPGNFMGSTVVHLSPQDPAPPSLSFVAALAVYEVVLARIGNPREVQLKWPNDVLLGGAKFCGLLLEREGGSAVIGIGVNLAEAPDVADRHTRTLAEYGPAPDRDAFAAELASQFDLELGRWRQYGLEPILSRWLAAAHPLGSALSVHEPSGTRVSGAFDGLEPDGALRLRLADGTVRVIHAGDVLLEGG
ncbi:biotin--[acetyl-CoA-carboxylase] ligase [Altererythrobacter soli]|uniref:biotin--[biotin carboxyl-carrier protein] ligase n=1 Tax=Croceibacterium soli TaxID=1739690 RepID=A0A6I4UTY2_9SPHN|nr:biotin--[acetyl-CoA-carboxylase] ligase [Croceibacterium soli]MXP42370.1 biotin--[acetyl-CoA-carboxylase] ligase [Croceibacterium soli]